MGSVRVHAYHHGLRMVLRCVDCLLVLTGTNVVKVLGVRATMAYVEAHVTVKRSQNELINLRREAQNFVTFYKGKRSQVTDTLQDTFIPEADLVDDPALDERYPIYNPSGDEAGDNDRQAGDAANDEAEPLLNSSSSSDAHHLHGRSGGSNYSNQHNARYMATRADIRRTPDFHAGHAAILKRSKSFFIGQLHRAHKLWGDHFKVGPISDSNVAVCTVCEEPLGEASLAQVLCVACTVCGDKMHADCGVPMEDSSSAQLVCKDCSWQVAGFFDAS